MTPAYSPPPLLIFGILEPLWNSLWFSLTHHSPPPLFSCPRGTLPGLGDPPNPLSLLPIGFSQASLPLLSKSKGAGTPILVSTSVHPPIHPFTGIHWKQSSTGVKTGFDSWLGHSLDR